MLKRLLRRPGAQGALAGLIGLYLEFALRTTRWTLHGGEYLATGRPAVVAFWHECLPLMAPLWIKAQAMGAAGPTRILVSRHRDGRFLGAVMRRFRVDVVHGSSEAPGSDRARGGSAGLRRLVGLLEQGGYVAITPDGPRGPRRHAAPGVVLLAALSGAPVLPAAAQTSRRHVLGTWDRMVLPLPFGRGVIVCGDPIEVPRRDRDAALARIAAALTEAADRADRLCRSPD